MGYSPWDHKESDMTEQLSMRERAPVINPTHEKERMLQITEPPDHEITLLWELSHLSNFLYKTEIRYTTVRKEEVKPL